MHITFRVWLVIILALTQQACGDAALEPVSPNGADASKVAFSALSGAETAAGESLVTIHVSPRGRNDATGKADSPLRTLGRAILKADAGTLIVVHAGIYDEHIETTKSGAPGHPIVVQSAGDGEVTITAQHPPAGCDGDSPVRTRTIELIDGADHWTFKNLTVVGGIVVSGLNTGDNLKENLGNRSLPGRGSYDPNGARSTLPRLGSDPAEGNQFVNLKVRGRGIYGVAARRGRIENTEISNIECGTGGGIWLGRFSDQWSIKRNHVHHIAASIEHFMTEGIRFSGASNYNVVENNLVEHILGKGRGITTDVFASFNTIQNNRVRNATVGFSEQQGGWGNKWLGNVSERNDRTGFAVFLMGLNTPPSDEDTPSGIEMRDNRSVGDGAGLQIGAIKQSHFSGNSFPKVEISPNLRIYWRREGNTWNGTRNPPPAE